jgi:hypothetical protein
VAATAIAALDCGAASRPPPDVSLTPGGRAVDGRFVYRLGDAQDVLDSLQVKP